MIYAKSVELNQSQLKGNVCRCFKRILIWLQILNEYIVNSIYIDSEFILLYTYHLSSSIMDDTYISQQFLFTSFDFLILTMKVFKAIWNFPFIDKIPRKLRINFLIALILYNSEIVRIQYLLLNNCTEHAVHW